MGDKEKARKNEKTERTKGRKRLLTLSLPECLIEFCEVTRTFEFVDEIL